VRSVSPLSSIPKQRSVRAVPGAGQGLDAAPGVPRGFGRDLSAIRVHAGGAEGASETEADRVSDLLVAGRQGEVRVRVPAGTVQRQARPPSESRYKTAEGIVNIAEDTKRPVAARAVAVVRAIVAAYYANDADKVQDVVYDDAKAGSGLKTESKQDPSSKKWTGTIYVGDRFLRETTRRNFAHRVLQVGHELEHVEQHREGLGGEANQDQREFLAFYHEALASPKPNTGRIQHSTALLVIDAAVGYYHCLSKADQKRHEAKRTELLKRRATEVTALKEKGYTNAPPPEPTSCKRQP